MRDTLAAEIQAQGTSALLTDIELPLLAVLARMELTGVRIDVEALDSAATSLRSRLATLEKEIYDLAGCEFNVGSPARVGEILFDRLQLDPKA